MPVEDVNLKITEVLTSDYEYEQRTIHYRDDITCAETEATVRQRYPHISRNVTKIRDVEQALFASKSTRRNRNPGGAKGGKGVSNGTATDQDDQNSSTKSVGKSTKICEQVSLLFGARTPMVRI